MGIFRTYVERLMPLVPTVWRRRADNLWGLWHLVMYEGADAAAAALDEFVVTSRPLSTASGWVLDAHWGPFHNLSRNGMDDATYRLYVRAKRLLNASWGAADQVLVILRMLLPPAATLTFIYWGEKTWEVVVGGIDIADAADAAEFLRKRPSPEGGGFSVAGDNGYMTLFDQKVMAFSSLQGPVPITGFFSSLQGPSGGDEAGWAHKAAI